MPAKLQKGAQTHRRKLAFLEMGARHYLCVLVSRCASVVVSISHPTRDDLVRKDSHPRLFVLTLCVTDSPASPPPGPLSLQE